MVETGRSNLQPPKLEPVTWKVRIFSQENIEILPGKSVLTALSFGVEMSEGATMVSLYSLYTEINTILNTITK